ncbi:hypothetical protein BLSTO_00793 [Blastocystis sp. subtype 1]
MDDLKTSIEEVIMGSRKMPQGALSKEQMGLLRKIADSPLSAEEKNSLLRYLFFCSAAYARCLESDMAKEVRQKTLYMKENEKLKEKGAKSTELINRLQDLNKAQADELDLIKTKEKSVFVNEKRLREQIMEKFMGSLEELQQKVDANSKDNQILVEENRSLREEFKQKAQQYQEQIQLSKEMITKLQEMNGLYEGQVSELTRYVTELGGKAKEAETLRKSLKEYTDLVKKQSEVISSFQENKEKLSSIIKQYEAVLASRNKEIKEKNVAMEEMEKTVADTKKEAKRATAQLEKMQSICRALQERLRRGQSDSAVESINIDELSEDELL